MTALAPLFLRFLPLAALPLLFHLFFRVRRRRRTFPSLLFFLAADPRVHYRRKVREWLLLLLRTLALLLLILGLARPVFRGSGGVPRKLAAVVDNSASMRAVDAAGEISVTDSLCILDLGSLLPDLFLESSPYDVQGKIEVAAYAIQILPDLGQADQEKGRNGTIHFTAGTPMKPG